MFSEDAVLTFVQIVISKAWDKTCFISDAGIFGLWYFLCAMIYMVNCEHLTEGGDDKSTDHLYAY